MDKGRWFWRGRHGFIHGTLHDINRYFVNIEEILKIKSSEFEEHIQKEAGKLPPEQAEDYLAFHSETFWDFSKNFPQIIRSSVFVNIYTTLEYELSNICLALQEKKQLNQTPSDLKNRGISLSQEYIKQVANLKFPDETPIWKEIKIYNKLRNILVHSKGKVDDNGSHIKAIKKYINENKELIKLSEINRIEMEPKFIDKSIKTVDEFFNHLFDSFNKQGVSL